MSDETNTQSASSPSPRIGDTRPAPQIGDTRPGSVPSTNTSAPRAGRVAKVNKVRVNKVRAKAAAAIDVGAAAEVAAAQGGSGAGATAQPESTIRLAGRGVGAGSGRRRERGRSRQEQAPPRRRTSDPRAGPLPHVRAHHERGDAHRDPRRSHDGRVHGRQSGRRDEPDRRQHLRRSDPERPAGHGARLRRHRHPEERRALPRRHLLRHGRRRGDVLQRQAHRTDDQVGTDDHLSGDEERDRRQGRAAHPGGLTARAVSRSSSRTPAPSASPSACPTASADDCARSSTTSNPSATASSSAPPPKA